MTHQALLSFRSPGVPVFEVTVATLSRSCICEIKKYRSVTTVALLFPLIKLTNENELL